MGDAEADYIRGDNGAIADLDSFETIIYQKIHEKAPTDQAKPPS